MSTNETTTTTTTTASNDDKLKSRNSDVIALEHHGYKLGRKIGKGSYASVVSAQYKDDQNKRINLACKIVDREKAPIDFLENFFPRELSIITEIEHPNIIPIHSILQRGKKIFIFMKYAENGDLLNFIKTYGPIPENQTRLWFQQMVLGLKYLHSLNIAHRDLKCENVLISKRMNIKLADFGFARYCCDMHGKSIYSKTYCGSAAYASPEVVSGVPYNPKIADIWSLGVILFIMLNARMPFDDSNLSKLLDHQKEKKFHFREKIVNETSRHCITLVGQLLDPNPKTRLNIERILKSKWFRVLNNDFENIENIPTNDSLVTEKVNT